MVPGRDGTHSDNSNNGSNGGGSSVSFRFLVSVRHTSNWKLEEMWGKDIKIHLTFSESW